MEENREIVFTYRQSQQVEEVVLRCERELPERMRQGPDIPAFVEERQERRESLPEPWRRAIAPAEEPKKGRWGVRLFVGLSLLVGLVCLGVGMWYVGLYGWALPGETPEPSYGQTEPPPGEDDYSYYYYWDDTPAGEEISIARYPAGGETRLSLTGAAGRSALTPGDIYTRVMPTVVTVLGRQRDGYSSVGTGVIFSTDGYIVTNCHVINGSRACSVLITDSYGADREYRARLVGYDRDVDLAVLKVGAPDLPAAEFGVSDDLQVGEPAYAIGNPLGIDLRSTMTSGIISAINRDVDVEGVTMTLIQTDAALNSGNSGGPLINQYGQVVGINTIKMMSEYDTIEGLGFAIPSSLALRWINELIAFGELQPQPVLGISIALVPTTLPDGNTGLEVAEITPGLSGDLAGVRKGDCVVAFNGQRVYSTEEILAIRRDLYVGDEVAIRVYRDGEYLDLTMTMMAE